MKRLLIICYSVLICSFVLPLFLSVASDTSADNASATPLSAVSLSSDTMLSPASVHDEVATRGDVWECITVKLADGSVREMDMSEYLIGVLAGEMPASFQAEALRAQAVAARTYAMYCAASGRHGEAAQVCASSGCCQAWLDSDELSSRLGPQREMYYEKLRYAVDSTAGQYLAYEGEPVLAAFHSSSAGVTEGSGAVWNALPYLVSVSTPETDADVPGYISYVDLTPEELRRTVLSLHPEADFSASAEKWLGDTILGDSGRVESVVLGGVSVSGSELRQAFALRSTAFELGFSDGAFRFTVTGFGHGVGMSQYGANVMAANGATYDAILAHYYPGTTLCTQYAASE